MVIVILLLSPLLFQCVSILRPLVANYHCLMEIVREDGRANKNKKNCCLNDVNCIKMSINKFLPSIMAYRLPCSYAICYALNLYIHYNVKMDTRIPAKLQIQVFMEDTTSYNTYIQYSLMNFHTIFTKPF